MAVVERWDLLSFGHHIVEYWLTLSANTLSTYQSNISGHVNWVSVLSVYISRPISLKPDWIQLCVTVGWLINTVYHKRIQGGGKLKKEHRAWSLLSLKRKAPYIRQCGAYLREGLIYQSIPKPPTSPKAHPRHLTGVLLSIVCENRYFSSLLAAARRRFMRRNFCDWATKNSIMIM